MELEISQRLACHSCLTLPEILKTVSLKSVQGGNTTPGTLVAFVAAAVCPSILQRKALPGVLIATYSHVCISEWPFATILFILTIPRSFA